MGSISERMEEHYKKTFEKHGATSLGVDWGAVSADHQLRLQKMLSVLLEGHEDATVLDVGCGFGSLYDLIVKNDMSLRYSGVDLCENMINYAKKQHPNCEWIKGDFLSFNSKHGMYDYVVCNGILTQKLVAGQKEMDSFAKELIKKMFSMCNVGVAFNIMTTHANYFTDNLYYRNPAELLGWIMSELTGKVKLDHSYPLFEYTLYFYKEDFPLMSYGAHRTLKGEV